MVEFAPRARFEGGFVDTPRHDVHYSRWEAGPTSFGPVGRILATLLVILFGPWTTSAFAILYTPAWLMVAAISLKSIWKSERVIEGSSGEGWRERNRGRHPVMFKRIGNMWVALPLLGAGYAYMLVRMGTVGRTLMLALTLCVGLGLTLAWLSDV